MILHRESCWWHNLEHDTLVPFHGKIRWSDTFLEDYFGQNSQHPGIFWYNKIKVAPQLPGNTVAIFSILLTTNLSLTCLFLLPVLCNDWTRFSRLVGVHRYDKTRSSMYKRVSQTIDFKKPLILTRAWYQKFWHHSTYVFVFQSKVKTLFGSCCIDWKYDVVP